MADLEQRLAQLTPLQRAVLALKETQQRLEALERQRDEPIAIIGMGCRFPGGANDVESFWRMLCEEANAIREIPAERWDVDAYYDPDPAAPGKMNTRWGGFLEKIDEFDNHFFSISDREATRIDPQHRLVLELTWESLEDAGIPPSSLRGSKTGVYIGLSHSEYGMMLSTDMAQSDAYVSTGTAHCLAANRVSFMYDFHGPSVMLDTACSSSLVAVHLACLGLRAGEADLAVAGGVNVILSPLGTVNLTKAGFSSSDGQVRAFDAAASGYVRSEGAGLVVLKPLSAAVRDGDRIYAVIRGSAINQNGFSNGLTAPSRPAQERVLRQAYAAAKIPPAQVQYVETQGTGTRLGDAIEALSLGEVLKENRPAEQRCGIGSVKTNLGHMEAASGAASLMKVALALRRRQIPPTLNFKTPSPDIPFDSLPLSVQRTLAPWPTTTTVRTAGVSAFGFGGSNAHLVLTEAPETTAASAARSATSSGRAWLPISARTDSALKSLARKYVEFLRGADPSQWADICHTASQRRDHHDCRLALRATGTSEAAHLLERYLAGESAVLTGRKPFGREPKLAIACGELSAAADEAFRAAVVALPHWASAVAEVDEAWKLAAGWTLSSALGDSAAWTDERRRGPAQIALQIALVQWLRSAGMSPAIVVGSGNGEIVAAAIAGILTIPDAARLAVSLAKGAGLNGSADLKLDKSRIPCISAADGRAWSGPDLTLDAWVRRMRQSANWHATLETLRQREVDATIGCGNQPSDVGPDDVPLWAALVGSSAPSADVVSGLIGQLYCTGVTLRWNRLPAPTGGHVTLPTYPWQRHRLWAERKDWLANAHGRTGRPVPGESSTASGRIADSKSTGASFPGLVPESTQARQPRPELNNPYAPPTSPLEQDLAAAWREILKLEQVGIHDNFFELGGDSIQAMILHNLLQDTLGEVVQGYVLFQAQTIASLSNHLREHYGAAVRRRYPDESTRATGGEAANPSSLESLAPSTLRREDIAQIRALVEQFAPPPKFPAASGPKNRRVIFVLAPPGGGGEAVAKLLAAQPGFYAANLELLNVPSLAERARLRGASATESSDPLVVAFSAAFGGDETTARQLLARLEARSGSIHEVYRELQLALGERQLVDATPDYSAFVDILRQGETLFEDARYIHVLRHPCGAMRQFADERLYEPFLARFAPGMELPLAPHQLGELTWLAAHQNIHEFLRDVPASRQLMVRYEELAQAPGAIWERLASFLGTTAPSAAELAALAASFSALHPDTWRQRMRPDVLGPAAREAARAWGYDDVPLPSTSDSPGGIMALSDDGMPGPIAMRGIELVTGQRSAQQASELLGRLDDLSDEEVEALLQQQLLDEAGNG